MELVKHTHRPSKSDPSTKDLPGMTVAQQRQVRGRKPIPDGLHRGQRNDRVAELSDTKNQDAPRG